ncbi:glucan endo-1,3-beta-D-glucosidase [Polaribacter porphyrae]|uniref:Glucan endo-1,3-beta-D-glucosidase n=1 Tax=Polaribacter porphyrae TaxID=1137780 RepID=A0A2S7WMA7_9FLAO|nr:glucan endo-1,3-beta-D-glucosidase [Polaribacter porphyrae]PQJ78713.1 glucan endo-1,3-beta-D-glucosidase [Polaribacter porphyrae]
MKKIKNKLIVLFSLITVLYSCQEDEYSFGEIITPSNIQITAEVIGVDSNNPNGDGSGEVKFTVTADNAVSFKFVHDGAEYLALTGEQKIIFSKLGLNTYTVTAVASGTAGVSSSKTIQVDVLATYSPPNDLTAKLFGFDPANPNTPSSKTWKIQSAKPGHFGLGPVGGTTPTEWYGAGIDEKNGVGMYDDRITFSSDGTYSHVTNGDIFGRDPHVINDLGPNTAGTVDGADILNYAYADYSATYSLTAPGGVETINLTGNSFIGYYTGGNHQYEIFGRDTPNEMILRTTDADSTFDWWFIIVAE